MSNLHVSLDEYYTEMLRLVGTRSTCPRRQVGAIITDEKGVVLAMGYNGVPRGMIHCTETPCIGRWDSPGSSDRCLAVHAEQNALLQCADLNRAYTIYVSCTPCFNCSKIIANTGIRRVVVLEHYADERGLEVFNTKRITLLILPPRG